MESSVSVPDDFVPDFVYIQKSIWRIREPASITSRNACGCSGDCDASAHSCSCMRKNGGKVSGKTSRPSPIYECGPECGCSASCGNRDSQKGIQKRLDIFKAGGKGWGVRAGEFIPRDTFLCEYVGEIGLSGLYSSSKYMFELNRKGLPCIDAEKFGNVSRMLNHSCDGGNVRIEKVLYDHMDKKKPHIAMYAARDIHAGEELLFSYSGKENKYIYGDVCLCNKCSEKMSTQT